LFRKVQQPDLSLGLILRKRLFQGSTPNSALLKLLACNPVTQEPNLELAKYIEHDNTNNFVKFQSYDLKQLNINFFFCQT
jgi:hypothetical protein